MIFHTLFYHFMTLFNVSWKLTILVANINWGHLGTFNIQLTKY